MPTEPTTPDVPAPDAGIPLVDLARWFDGSVDERRAFATEVDAHLRRLGFLVVVNHGVARSLIDDFRELAREFFHQPAARKSDVTLTAGTYRGWVGPGLESNAASYGVQTAPDLKESFAFGPVDVVDERLRDLHPDSFAPNVWPELPAGFREAAEAWWHAARSLHDELLDVASLALGLPLDHLRSLCRATTASAGVNWYGPRGAVDPLPDQYRIGPHTDFGLLTVLDREPGLGGLQVLDEDGEWIDAPVVPGSLIINTGDLVRRWTNDRWCSNVHRVLPPPAANPQEELISLVFFGEPDRDALVEAFASCVSDDDPARYPPVLAHEYLAEKMRALVVDA